MPLSPPIPGDPRQVLISPHVPQVFVGEPEGKLLSHRKHAKIGSCKNGKGVSFPPVFCHSPPILVHRSSWNTFTYFCIIIPRFPPFSRKSCLCQKDRRVTKPETWDVCHMAPLCAHAPRSACVRHRDTISES